MNDMTTFVVFFSYFYLFLLVAFLLPCSEHTFNILFLFFCLLFLADGRSEKDNTQGEALSFIFSKVT
jgi:hypothetical protein